MEHDRCEKAVSVMEADKMLRDDDKIVVGVSGGADSVCLLFLLCEYRKKHNLQLCAVHINHGIRKEAGDDENFVRELCEEWNVQFTAVHEDVPGKAAKWSVSEEEAGRRVRYEAFAEAASCMKASEEDNVKIAVAHNAGDNAETVLFHLFRGSGLHGLTGIPATRTMEWNGSKYEIIRPLLGFARKDIENILNERGISWVTDITNTQDEYSRNKIRLNILPEAEKVAPGALNHINETAKQLAETEDFLQEIENEAVKDCVLFSGESAANIVIDCSKAIKLHKVMLKRVLLKCLRDVTGGGRDIGALQVEQLLELVLKAGNRKLDLARGVLALREYDRVVISKKDNPAGSPASDNERCKSLPELQSEVLEAKNIPGGIEKLIEDISHQDDSNKYTKYLDYDKIDGQIEVRFRRSGDYITIASGKGEIGRKSLKDLMIDSKIPSSMRDEILVVATGNHCLWLVGYRISECCKLSVNTQKVIKISINNESEKRS